MSLFGAGGGGPPSKKLKIDGDGGRGASAAGDAKGPLKNLREVYIKILQLIIDYNSEYKEFPNANSTDFHQFVEENGLDDISQERLSNALLFMEESFRDFVRTRGLDAHFATDYLENRFQLSKKIWGPKNQDSSDDQEQQPKEASAFDDVLQNVNLDHEIGGAVDDEEYGRDSAILKALYELKNPQNGAIPEPDSDVLYKFLVALPIPRIPQDVLVDRILILEENFNRIDIDLIVGEDIPELADPGLKEIHNLSRKVWGVGLGVELEKVDDNNDGAEVIDDDQGQFGQDLGRGDHENAGEDNQAAGAAVEEDDLGGVEDD